MKKSRRWMFSTEGSARSPRSLSGSLRFPRPVTAARVQRSVRWMLRTPSGKPSRIQVWPY